MSDIERLTDAELMAAYLAGDRGAFAAIYDRYADTVFSHNLAVLGDRDDAADATHDVFMKASTRLKQLEKPEELRPWLLAIALSEAGAKGGDPATVALDDDKIVPAPAALRTRVLDDIDRRVGAVATIGSNPELVKLGIFAAVALVVGLIGLAVSAQFEPLEPVPTVSPAEAPPAAGASTTTTTTATTTTSSADPGSGATTTTPAATTTASAEPAALEVSSDTVDLGGDASVGEFDLTNTGGRAGEWTLVSSNDAIAVSAGSGELGGGESVTIDLDVNRDEIEEGEISETLTINWSGGEIPVSIVGTNEANPIVHNPQASPSSVEVAQPPDCPNNQSTISARIRDASPLDSVVVRWSPDGSSEQETPMDSVGNDMFEAVVGPFTSVHTATVRIVAFDDRGNAGGATTEVAVVPCP